MTQTREQWLESAVKALTPLLMEVKETFLGDMRATAAQPHDPPAVRVSVGWPSKGGTRSKGKVIGQCWKSTVATDGVPQIFISPLLGGNRLDSVPVLGVVLHELIHAWDDCQSGHKGRFARTAKAVGLEGKMTATVPGAKLELTLAIIAEQLGPYPHSAINFEEMEKVAGKQGTRMLKLMCPEDGYIVRTTAKWLDDLGYPSCPCGSRMEDG